MFKKTNIPFIYFLTSVLFWAVFIASAYFSVYVEGLAEFLERQIELIFDVPNIILVVAGFVLFILSLIKKYPHKKYIVLGLIINIVFNVVRVSLV